MPEDSRRLLPNRGATPVIGIILMVTVTIIVATVLVAVALTFLPDEDPNPRPNAAFAFERNGSNALQITPKFAQSGTTYDLLINGQNVYTWQSDQLAEQRNLQCLFPGDEVLVRTRYDGGRSYVMARQEIESATTCPLSGTSVPFAAAIVGDKRVNLFDPTYEFTLSIDPQGEGTGEGPVPVTNEWHYVERFDRSLEGLSGPTWLIVLADNANYDADAPPDAGVDSFEIKGDDVVPTPGGSEPTNDSYLVFSPGCDRSTLKLVDVRASYENDILLGDQIVIDNTNTATKGEYEAPGVTCSGP